MKFTGTNSTKGSSSRVTDREAFTNNWEAIFGKHKEDPEPMDVMERLNSLSINSSKPKEEREVFAPEGPNIHAELARLTSQNKG